MESHGLSTLDILQAIHSVMRWLVLLFAVLTVIVGLRGMGGRRNFTGSDKRPALFLLISCDIQLLLGFVIYFLHGYQHNFAGGVMKEVMKAPAARFWTIEHLTGMLLGIVLVHVGYAVIKTNRSHAAKFRRLFWCSFIALIVFVATIPWPFRKAGIARPWLPGMEVRAGQ